MTEQLVQYNAMRTALVKARSIDEVKDIRDRAEALRAYAKQAGEGLESQNMIAEIKLRAERRAGELLQEMEKATGTRGDIPEKVTGGRIMRPPVQDVPTLAEVGITKSQSSRWQAIATVPEEVFEQHIAAATAGQKELTTAATLKVAKAIAYQRKDAERASVTSSLPPTVKLYHGDFREKLSQVPDDSVDLILTDPPYPAEFLPLWSGLAELASRVLKPGGYMFAYSGQSFLPEIYAMLGQHLTYQWTAAVQHKNGFTRVWKHDLLNSWKPVLIYSKGKPSQTLRGMVDMIGTGQGAKDEHEWSQPEGESAYYINYMTLPGQVVLDPMMGSGTSIVAAHKLGRCTIGCEIDDQHFATVRGKF